MFMEEKIFVFPHLPFFVILKLKKINVLDLSYKSVFWKGKKLLRQKIHSPYIENQMDAALFDKRLILAKSATCLFGYNQDFKCVYMYFTQAQDIIFMFIFSFKCSLSSWQLMFMSSFFLKYTRVLNIVKCTCCELLIFVSFFFFG